MANNQVIDCTDYESALLSIQTCIGIEKDILTELVTKLDYSKERARLNNLLIDLDAWENCAQGPGDILMYKLIYEMGYKLPKEVDCVFFHLTRIYKKKPFVGPIQPLGMVLDSIWENLYELVAGKVSEVDWQEFRTSLDTESHQGHYAGLYYMKTKDTFHYGPYALLIREMIYIANINHYLDCPEIIQDIIESIPSNWIVTSKDMLQSYQEATTPVVIKFMVRNYNKKHKIFVEVLNYIYDKLHDVELSPFTFCHDQKGLSISADDVLSIEELNQVRIQ